MLNTYQVVSHVNIWNVLRTPVLHDGCEGFAASELPRQFPALSDFTNNGNLNQIQSAITFVGYLPNEEAPILVQWSPTFAEYSINGGHLNSASATTEPKPCFDFGCNVLASAVQVIADFISESRKVRESWERFYRASILSSAVSKDGHLSFLIPSYREVCIKTAARDHVVHLEVITLAEEQEAPGTSAVGQMLISGGKSWMRMISSLLNLFLDCSEKVLSFGFIGAGLNFANAEVL